MLKPPVEKLTGITLPGYGYRWIRLARGSTTRATDGRVLVGDPTGS